MTIDQIEKAIEQIRMQPNSQVDCGTDQGQERFFAHVNSYSSTSEMRNLPFDWHVAEADKSLKQIANLIKPYSLPADYLAFLKLYGGITISNEDSSFTSLGFGPMAEEWYPYLVGKVGLYENGFLKIGALRFRNPVEYGFMYVSFFLDIGGKIQRHRVIGVSMWKLEGLNLQDVFQDPRSCPFSWSVTADSFTEWLEIVAATNGRFGYL